MRAQHRLGLHGLLGLVLIGLALSGFVIARQQYLASTSGPMPVSTAPPITKNVPRAPTLALPSPVEVPQLLARMQRAATAEGLGWPRADYQVRGATEHVPASLEVRCTLRGAYPKLRRFVAALLQDTPALTLKEFSLSRPNAESEEVEARIAIVVYLASQPVMAPAQ